MNYENLPKSQLIELCRQRNCKGYSTYNKSELIELLQRCPNNNCIKSTKLKCKNQNKVCNPKSGRCIKIKYAKKKVSPKKSSSKSKSAEKKVSMYKQKNNIIKLNLHNFNTCDTKENDMQLKLNNFFFKNPDALQNIIIELDYLKRPMILVNIDSEKIILRYNKKLGEGTYGAVYLMTNDLHNVRFALKLEVVKPGNPSETQIIKHLNNSSCNIINIRNLGNIMDNDNNIEIHFHIMNMYDGDLYDLKPKLFINDKADINAVLHIVETIRKQILCIYEYDNNYVYTDLKAENILYKCTSLSNIKVILADLGTFIRDRNGKYTSTYPSVEHKKNKGWVDFGNKNLKFKKESYLSWQIGVLILFLSNYDIDNLYYRDLKSQSRATLLKYEKAYKKLTGFNHLSISPKSRTSIYTSLTNRMNDECEIKEECEEGKTLEEEGITKPSILLLGDSIIDNAAWNDVGKDTTAEYLKRMDLTVIDRAAEEAYTEKFFEFFDHTNPGIIVREGYVRERARKGIPYDGFRHRGDYYVLPVPKRDNKKWWRIPKKDRYAAISLGGNDLVLVGNFNVEAIQKNVAKIIKKLICLLDIPPKNFMYLIPYSPNQQLAEYMSPMLSQVGITVDEFYHNWIKNAKKMCQNLGITYISLSDFTDADRYNVTHIPEPTKQGARKIAERISNVIRS